MEAEGTMQHSLVSVVEEVLQQHGKSLNAFDFASRRAQEAALRRNEAAAWMRKMVGFVGSRELPDEPSEEEFRLALRSGIVLCNVLNKVNPGAIPKVVAPPTDSVAVPDGAALSVFQYFENVRNFLVLVEEMGLPSFEASDLEKGGKSARIVNCILALKKYSEWKEAGSIGSWKFGGIQKSTSLTKSFIRKNADLFTKTIVRNSSAEERLGEESTSGADEVGPLASVVRELLQDKKLEDIPMIVESMLSKVMEEFEQKLTLQREQSKTTSNDTTNSNSAKPLVQIPQIVSNVDESPTTIRQRTDNSETTSSTAISDSPKPLVEIVPQIVPKVVPQIISKVEESPTESARLNDNIKNKAPSKGVAISEEEAKETSNGGKLSGGPSEAYVRLKSQHDRLKSQQDRWKRLTEKYQKNIQDLKNILDGAKADAHFLKTQYQEEFSNLGNNMRTLAHAAQGYKKVLEDNRKLYNMVQDLKGSIRVYCRVRPFLPGEAASVNAVGHLDEGSITIISSAKNGKETKKSFTFNRVFGSSASQVEVFSDTQPLIRSVLDGYNVCIFAYGQTGSGKTFTMSGPDNITDDTAGVNYRALGDLFLISEQRKDTIAYDVSVQMIEIYNEQVRDLLATDGAHKRLEIRNNAPNGINVPDATLLPVASTSDVINLMNLGSKNRAVGSTAMNNRSSRSHSCLTVHVHGRDLTSGSVIRGSMHLVDLAGSERADKTEAVGDRLKEANYINKSLSALGDVISSLAQKNAHVPYRNSKLTQLLQDSLGGQAKTLMFVHITPEPDSVGETLSTLKFAERVSNVELGAAKSNKDTSSSSEVRELREQISSLKAALAKKDGDSERFRPQSSGRGSDEVETLEDRSNSMLTKTRSLDSAYLADHSNPNSKDDDCIDEDSDDLDAATDSSDPDLQTRLGMKFKKAISKVANGLDKRGSVPKTRMPNGVSPLSRKPVKSSASSDVKRKPGSGK